MKIVHLSRETIVLKRSNFKKFISASVVMQNEENVCNKLRPLIDKVGPIKAALITAVFLESTAYVVASFISQASRSLM